MAVKRLLRKTGFDVVRFEPNRYPLLRRQLLMKTCGVNVVLDVGANVGQYGQGLRNNGYRGRIVSFEPLATEFSRLKATAEADGNWQALNVALGDADGSSEINISSEYTQVSSVLEMLPSAVERRPFWQYTAKQRIEIKRLDSVFDTLCSSAERVMLKIDTQGYERRVLDGGERSLESVILLQLEMSLVPLYEGETLFHEMCPLLHQKGFRMVSIELGMKDEKTGHLFQVDGIFQHV